MVSQVCVIEENLALRHFDTVSTFITLLNKKSFEPRINLISIISSASRMENSGFIAINNEECWGNVEQMRICANYNQSSFKSTVQSSDVPPPV